MNNTSAVVVEWQTRYLEGVVGVRPWRFESSQPHIQIAYWSCKALNLQGFLLFPDKKIFFAFNVKPFSLWQRFLYLNEPIAFKIRGGI